MNWPLLSPKLSEALDAPSIENITFKPVAMKRGIDSRTAAQGSLTTGDLP